MKTLPIFEILDDLVIAISNSNRIILTSPTGTGKSTQIPQILLDHCQLNGRILVLQPRRIAARMLCSRVASERSISIGTEVGYQTRFDSCYSKNTKILFITAGLLSRYFLSNPELVGISAIVLDEFHERSIHNDLALGLVKNLQDNIRHDLKLIIMSATLGSDVLETYLPGSIYFQCKSRNFPVEISYLPPKKPKPIGEQAAEALRVLVQGEPTGDVLIFMPGVYEIRQTIFSCKKLRLNEKISYFPLYGDLPPENQDHVMMSLPGRKVVVATNIAETSLTIPGIRFVIDSGLARQNRYDPNRGLNTLFILPTSKDSADQRTGRAGREAPGKCIRLWSSQAHQKRNSRTDPEIKRIDLAEIILYLKVLGFHNVNQFPWIELPAQNLVDNAISLLGQLDALEGHDLSLTELGRRMTQIPAHPRIARLILEAKRRNCRPISCLIAAIISERSIILKDKTSRNSFLSRFAASLDSNFLAGLNEMEENFQKPPKLLKNLKNKENKRERSSEPITGDLFPLLNAVNFAKEHDFNPGVCQDAGIHGAASRQVWRTFRYYFKLTKERSSIDSFRENQVEEIIKSLITAYPDRLAKRRDSGSLIYLLENDRKAELARQSSVKHCNLILAIELLDLGAAHQRKPAVISLACEVRRIWLNELFPHHFHVMDTDSWNDTRLSVERNKTTYFNTLPIEIVNCGDVNTNSAPKILAEAIRNNNLPLKGWNKDVKNWIQRVQCVAQWFPEKGLKTYDEEMIEAVLISLCRGYRRYGDVKNKPCIGHVKGQLSHQERQFIELMAPDKITLTNGARMRIKYSPGKQPRGNAKIQDLFGLVETPCVAKGKQKVLIEILAPNFRPIQVTDDLPAFWKNLYPKAKKELSRRYPSHEWR